MKQKVIRVCFYMMGMMLLATGLTLNTKTSLGTSAIISMPFSISQIWDLNFGNTTYAVYLLFIAGQLMLCHRGRAAYSAAAQRGRMFRIFLQLPLCFLMTRAMNLISANVPILQEAYAGGFLGSFPGRVTVLLAAVTMTGCGTAMSLNMRLVHNPGDGIVRALAEAAGRTVGLAKNCFDLFSVGVSLALGLTFAGEVVGVGLGTAVAVLMTGRVVSLFNHLFSDRISALAGLEPDPTAKRSRKTEK